MRKFTGVLCGALMIFGIAKADMDIPMYSISPAKGDKIGKVTAKATPYGVLLVPNLQKLSPGMHGFHLHVNPTCGDDGMSAGGHFDPGQTNKHLGPYDNQGHLGDLPALYVDPQGNATLPILAPRLKLSDLTGHALMVHEGGDNYSDVPIKLGGGGARIACGVIK
ncbi:MAG: superoxide dismutase family protein [Coxiellaceae bacterium]|nr:MAG: superoxide dismutase family protein [Coxiellaceae bacterium]